MLRRQLLQSVTAAALVTPADRASSAPHRPPNFIIILCDDLGYGDISLDGAGLIKTPAIAQMAREGVYLSDYYAPANLCTPSRAGLLTGRYPIRTGLGYEVLRQNDERGLSPLEVTIGKALKPAGYATALFGKWHLGTVDASWPPTKHGFDTFFGIPYSHDMKPLSLFESHAGSEKVDQFPVDYPQLQQQFYAHAERFIEANADRPFFIELALSAPHLPEYPHAPFDITSGAGSYGAVVQEIDSIVARLLSKLRTLKLEHDTVVIFTSDNGPWFEGSSGGLRERKGGGGYDGGYRVPFIAWAPGRIAPDRRVSSMVMGIDVLPTFRAMAGLAPISSPTLDGLDMTDVLTQGSPSPHDELILFDNEAPIGVRTQQWKYLSAAYYRDAKLPFALLGYEELYDLRADPSESYSVALAHPEVLKAMKARLENAHRTFAPLRHKDIPEVYKALHLQMEHLQD